MADVVIGVVRGTHGLSGEVRVESLSDEIEHFLRLRSVDLQKEGSEPESFSVESVAAFRASVTMKFVGVDSIEQAQSLIGAHLLVDRRRAAKRRRGEYYAVDLIGCAVRQNKTVVGTVLGVVSTNASDLLEISTEDGETVLVPFVEEYVGRVRLRRRWIELKPTWELG